MYLTLLIASVLLRRCHRVQFPRYLRLHIAPFYISLVDCMIITSTAGSVSSSLIAIVTIPADRFSPFGRGAIRYSDRSLFVHPVRGLHILPHRLACYEASQTWFTEIVRSTLVRSSQLSFRRGTLLPFCCGGRFSLWTFGGILHQLCRFVVSDQLVIVIVFLAEVGRFGKLVSAGLRGWYATARMLCIFIAVVVEFKYWFP